MHRGLELSEDAHQEAERCLSCGTCNHCDLCREACPEGVLIPSKDVYVFYGNTGGQRSSATPAGAVTSTTPQGKSENKKDIMGHHGRAAHSLCGQPVRRAPGGLRGETPPRS